MESNRVIIVIISLKKTADNLRFHHQQFPRELKPEEQARNSIDQGSASDWPKICFNQSETVLRSG